MQYHCEFNGLRQETGDKEKFQTYMTELSNRIDQNLLMINSQFFLLISVNGCGHGARVILGYLTVIQKLSKIQLKCIRRQREGIMGEIVWKCANMYKHEYKIYTWSCLNVWFLFRYCPQRTKYRRNKHVETKVRKAVD